MSTHQPPTVGPLVKTVTGGGSLKRQKIVSLHRPQELQIKLMNISGRHESFDSNKGS